MKTSQIVAKAIVRLFFMLMLIAATVYYFSPIANDVRMKNTYFVIRNKLLLIFPSILIIGFITLLIMCVRNKYSKLDLNWLLVVNTTVLMVCCLALFFKVYLILK